AVTSTSYVNYNNFALRCYNSVYARPTSYTVGASKCIIYDNELYFKYSIVIIYYMLYVFFFFFQAEDGIRDFHVTGVQTCALPIYSIEAQLGGLRGGRAKGMLDRAAVCFGASNFLVRSSLTAECGEACQFPSF